MLNIIFDAMTAGRLRLTVDPTTRKPLAKKTSCAWNSIWTLDIWRTESTANTASSFPTV